jgi:hypothetical protein
MIDLAIGEIATMVLDGEQITYTAQLAGVGCDGCLFTKTTADGGIGYASAAAETKCKTHACDHLARPDERPVIFVRTTPKQEQLISTQSPTLLEIVRRMIVGETSDTIGYQIQYDLGSEPLVFTSWDMVTYQNQIMVHAISGKIDSDWKVVPVKKTIFYFSYQQTQDSEPIFFHGSENDCVAKRTEVVMTNAVIIKGITKLK